MPLPVIFKFITDMSGARFDTVVSEMDNVKISSLKASSAIKHLGQSLIAGHDPVSSITSSVGLLAKGFGPLGIGITAGVAAIAYFGNESKKAKESAEKLAQAVKGFEESSGTLDLGGAIAQFQSLNKIIGETEEKANQPGLLGKMAAGAVGFFGGNQMELESNMQLAKSSKKQAEFAVQTQLARDKDLMILKRSDPLMASSVTLAEKHRTEMEKMKKLGFDQITLDALLGKQQEERRDFARKAIQDDNEKEVQGMLKAADERAKIRSEEDKAFDEKTKKENEAFNEQRKQEELLFNKRQDTIAQGKEAAGTLLDRIKGAAERLGMTRVVNQINMAQEKEKDKTAVALVGKLGLSPGKLQPFGPNEKIGQLAQTEGETQRESNDKLYTAFTDMQALVQTIVEKIESSINLPVLKSA